MLKITDKLTQVRNSIQAIALECHRNPHEVTLLAVSKTQPVERIEEAFLAGQRDFGENYLQEALGKIQSLKHPDITWHFIGPIQSNKTRDIAAHFHWVHSVDRLKIAQRLNDHRPETLPKLNICIQVNIDHEPTKSGCTPNEVIALAQAIQQDCPRLHLRGLMAIPSQTDPARAFTSVRELLTAVNHTSNLQLDTLSMGMSQDMEDAIRAGSTCVRIGTAIFGKRI